MVTGFQPPGGFAARVAVLVLSSLATLASAHAAGSEGLFELSIEELLQVEVTSASRKKQSLSETAAAVFVITARDIELSGAKSIPEALRLAPGMQVIRIDASKWAVSARGFSGRYSNKLLVLMDGRTLYSPLFSGIHWDMQYIPMEQVERIEVIRGPGGAVWGANAVNAVINVITRNADETLGGLVTAGADTESSASGSLRYGTKVGERGSLRMFAKVDDFDRSVDRNGNELADDWDMARVGGRYDRKEGTASLTVIGEAWSGDIGTSLQLTDVSGPPYFLRQDADEEVDGGFLLASWARETESGGNFTVQSFIEKSDREGFLLREDISTFDLDIKHRFAPIGRHEIQVGAGYRLYDVKLGNTSYIAVLPNENDFSVSSAFFQDEISLFDDRLGLTVGVKVEHYELFADDTEVLPTIRGIWKLSDQKSVWGAITRSARTPAYSDLDVSVGDLGPAIPPGSESNPGPVPVTTRNIGNPDASNGTVIAYELGYRAQLGDQASFDVALFYNDYENQTDVESQSATCEPGGIDVSVNPFCVFTADYIEALTVISNISNARTRGLEVSHRWAPNDRFQLSTVYSYVDASGEGRIGFEGTPRYGANAKHKLGLRADFILTPTQSLTVWPRYLSDVIENRNVVIEGYWDLDVRYGWQVTPSLLLEVTGNTLLRSRQPAYPTELREIIPTEVERRIFAGFRWSFPGR